MEIVQDLIPVGQGVRTGKKLNRCLGLAVHWIGAAQGHAQVIRNNFARDELGTQYIIDWYDGHIIQCVPDDEVCYHVGSVSYTDLKYQLVGEANPNWYFVGIECCIDPATVIPQDYWAAGKYMDLGKPSQVQYDALVEFAADFLSRKGLTADNLYRHGDLTGKICHVWFFKEEARWTRFKADVARKMAGEETMSREEITALVDRTVTAAVEKAVPPAVTGALKKAMPVYTSLEAVPAWARGLAERAVEAGLLRGDETGGLRLTNDNLVTLQILANAGVF